MVATHETNKAYTRYPRETLGRPRCWVNRLTHVYSLVCDIHPSDPAPSTLVWQHVQLPRQIRSRDPLACCRDVTTRSAKQTCPVYSLISSRRLSPVSCQGYQLLPSGRWESWRAEGETDSRSQLNTCKYKNIKYMHIKHQNSMRPNNHAQTSNYAVKMG